MGALFANAPGPRVSPAQALRLGSQLPAGASIDRAAETITFTTATVNLAVLGLEAGCHSERTVVPAPDWTRVTRS